MAKHWGGVQFFTKVLSKKWNKKRHQDFPDAFGTVVAYMF